MTVNVTTAKNKLTELLKLAERGKEIVIERHGKPVVRLARIVQPQKAIAK